jgi:hypothetical protein
MAAAHAFFSSAHGSRTNDRRRSFKTDTHTQGVRTKAARFSKGEIKEPEKREKEREKEPAASHLFRRCIRGCKILRSACVIDH